MVERKTAGQVSQELSQKHPDTLNPIELEQAMHSDYEKSVYECIAIHKKTWNQDFYVIVLTKKEPLMTNIIRHYYYGRLSCPTPDYDQTVYFYNKDNDIIEFLWTIPSRDACMYLKENSLLVDPAELQLLRYVLDFADGTLFRIAKARNGEKEDSPLLSD